MPDDGQLDAILDATQNVDSSNNCIDTNIQIADDANKIGVKPTHAPTSSVPSNIEWAKYLTSIDDIINDVNAPDPNGITSLDSLTASLVNPLESSAVDIQNHVIDTFSLNEYARLAHILPVPSCSNLKPHQPSVRSPVNPSTASLYLIPLSHDIARYRPFDRCKEFVDFLKDQPNYLQTIVEDVSEYTAVKEQRTISFRPKYEQPKPLELTLKQKIELIRQANIEIQTINGSPMKRPRKIRPSIMTKSINHVF